MLTKQDFDFLANLVKSQGIPHDRETPESGRKRYWMATAIADWIEERKPINDKFDRDRFMEASGFGANRAEFPGGSAADQESDCRAEISKARALLKRWHDDDPLGTADTSC